MPIVINSLKGGDTHTHTHTHIADKSNYKKAAVNLPDP